MTLMIWLGIAVCIVHSGMFPGLNLVFFSLGRLDLEVEVSKGNTAARKVLKLRQDSNFLTLDDEPMAREGEVIDPRTILPLPFHGETPVIPDITSYLQDPFLQKLNAAPANG